MLERLNRITSITEQSIQFQTDYHITWLDKFKNSLPLLALCQWYAAGRGCISENRD